jgi:hypothetical protein
MENFLSFEMDKSHQCTESRLSMDYSVCKDLSS